LTKLQKLHVMFVCLFIVVLCFSLEFSSNVRQLSCRCIDYVVLASVKGVGYM